MLSYTDTVMRIALNRMNVNASCLSRLLHVTSSLFRKTEAAHANNLASVVFEVLADGLRLKARIMPATLTAMLEV